MSDDDMTFRLGPTPGGPAKWFALLLHGVGSSPEHLKPLAEALVQALPDLAVTVAEGFDPFDKGPAGRQWFSVVGVTAENRRARIDAVLPRIQALLDDEASKVAVDPARSAVCGFSQGAILAEHLAAWSPQPPAVVIALAGRVAGALASPVGPRPRVLLSHGSNDKAIPPVEMDLAAEALRGAGCVVETHLVEGHGHDVHPDQIQRAIAHLQAWIRDQG